MTTPLSQAQQNVLNVAAQDLTRGRWVSGRKLRSSLPLSNSLQANSAIVASLTPQFLSRQDTGAEDRYSLTLDGILQSQASEVSSEAIGAILRCLRDLFARDPDIRHYTWQDVQPYLKEPRDFEHVNTMIEIAGLVNGGGGSPGSPDYKWGTPLEIEEISRTKDVDDFVQYRRLPPPPSKTLGPTAARLVTTLHERRRTIFTLRDVVSITRLQPKSARTFMSQIVGRGIATRLKPGLFTLVPQELGREREFLGNPYVVARELVDGTEFFLSHAAAMDLHRMVTQPQFVIYATSTRSIRRRTVLGTEFRFVRCKPEHMFGTTDVWVDKSERVKVSDLERTIIDGLRQPEYCGGISEVAKGFWMRRGDIAARTLVDYALRLDVGSVIRRLGFLLEVFQIEAHSDVERLRSRLTATYDILDPTLPAEGRHLSRWKLRLNVSPEEIETVRST